VEDKDYSIALHYRLAPQLGGQVMDAVAAIYDRAGVNSFEILPGKSVVEIKPRGFNKGVGLKYLMRHAPFAGRRPVFVGDDTTDHAAFAVLPDFKGIGYSVGGIVPGASFNFDGPKDVRLWLEDMSRGVAVEAR
ncbi:MAG: trehalose-phosphatase, partial [Pseudorhodoplanes sp.]|nr:trehalose-phosphatase [Pseudorhodoplanes sp.]